MSERSVRSGGRLLIVGTPIGNLGDLSPRAAEALATADVIACEDTRRTGRLLQLSGIEKRPLLVCNEHTEVRAFGEVAARVAAGETVALVSDAGMPGISMPSSDVVITRLPSSPMLSQRIVMRMVMSTGCSVGSPFMLIVIVPLVFMTMRTPSPTS